MTLIIKIQKQIMSQCYLIPFFFLIFSVNDCSELTTVPTSPQNVTLPPFAHEITFRILNQPSSYLFSDQGNADEYIDRLFTGLKEYLSKNFEPFRWYNVAPEVKSIYLEGLSTIVRTGSVTISNNGDYTYVTANLGFQKFKGQAVIEKHLWWFVWFTGTAHIDVNGIEFYFKLRGHIRDSKLKLNLEKLDIKDWGKMEISVHDTNWLGWIAGVINYFFPNIAINWIKNNIPSMLHNGLNEALKYLQIPLFN